MTNVIDEAKLGEFMGSIDGNMIGGAPCFAVWLGEPGRRGSLNMTSSLRSGH
jgi:hypothetical protein